LSAPAEPLTPKELARRARANSPDAKESKRLRELAKLRQRAARRGR
jgi:hypothetical protein